MKFGPVHIDKAQGAILAHSIALPGGRLRKGRLLTEGDLAVLAQQGHKELIVAQLDDEDVDENTAAARLAKAVLGEGSGLELTEAATGRVNILTDGPGLVVLNSKAIAAINAVDPMITIATTPPYQQLRQGGMAATVKIISYAVTGDALAQACAAAGQGGAMTLARPALQGATLIVTDVPGGAGDKGSEAIEDRLQAYGVTLEGVITVPHEADALAKALAAVQSDLALILTGSATSDPYDVAPSALRQAGGQVVRFGMPVDPGNLLFLGHIDSRPVIGLPGCARSPALNGADWVLGRVICGLPVTNNDIASMGVGGLLKEIPSRPQPRLATKGL